jgi:hypothetical protein
MFLIRTERKPRAIRVGSRESHCPPDEGKQHQQYMVKSHMRLIRRRG